MTLPKFTYEHKGDPLKIFTTAVKTMGEDISFVLQNLSHQYCLKNLNLKSPTVLEWYYLMNSLYLDLSTIQYGYCKRIHQVKIWRAIKNGNYMFRITLPVQKLIEKMRLEEE